MIAPQWSHINPPAPFPLVLAQAAQQAFIAPGVMLERYDLMTNRGPIVVRILAVDPHADGVRVATALAHDRLVSAGETVSSMARRSGAVGGINADYFDIGQTNQPLGIVVRDGSLARTPSKRATMSVMRDAGVRVGSFSFAGSANSGSATWPIGAIDEWPAQGTGTVLMLPVFGSIPARPGGAFAALEPIGPPAPNWSGTYRVAAFDPSGAGRGPSFGLAFSPGAVAEGSLPALGATVSITTATDPPLTGIAAALGGGPQLVADGHAFDDPNPPSPAEALQRDPQAGAFCLADGQIGFAEVDGRTPDVSVGLTRPEFAALFLSLGASDAIGFDSGGSATLVARTPGDAVATVQNAPSDGVERPVADAFLVFSDLPAGPPARLAVRPSPAVILSGAAIAPYAVVTDAAGHPLQSVAEARAAVPTMRLSVDPASVAGPAADGRLVGAEPGSAILLVGERGLSERVPLQVVSTLARLRLEPARANPDPGGVVQYRAEGFDAPGTPVELGTMVTWRASNGSVDGDGRLHVGASDATIVAEAGGRRAEAVVRVGRRRLPIDAFGPRVVWKYSTYPAGGQGAVVTASDARPSELDLQYDFGAGVRAAYAGARIDLGGEPLGFSVDVRGDGSGAGVRAAFLNSRGERVLVTVAKRIAWTGWQRCDVSLPPSAVPPLRLASLYVVSSLGGPPAHGAGTVAFRDLRIDFAGSSAPVPLFTTSP